MGRAAAPGGCWRRFRIRNGELTRSGGHSFTEQPVDLAIVLRMEQPAAAALVAKIRLLEGKRGQLGRGHELDPDTGISSGGWRCGYRPETHAITVPDSAATISA